MNNNLDPGSIKVNMEEGESRLYTDSGKNIEDKNTDFQQNMINYYEKKDSIEENKANKEELTNELEKKATGLFGIFFNKDKVKDDEDFRVRCINASKVTIIMIATCALYLLNFRNSNGYDIGINLASLILFGYACIALKKADKKGVYAGILASLLCVISLSIIKMVIGLAYILGMLYLSTREREDDNKK